MHDGNELFHSFESRAPSYHSLLGVLASFCPHSGQSLHPFWPVSNPVLADFCPQFWPISALVLARFCPRFWPVSAPVLARFCPRFWPVSAPIPASFCPRFWPVSAPIPAPTLASFCPLLANVSSPGGVSMSTGMLGSFASGSRASTLSGMVPTSMPSRSHARTCDRAQSCRQTLRLRITLCWAHLALTPQDTVSL